MSAAAADNYNNNNGNVCANCGKGEESTNSLKVCTACKLVKYCNRECQIAHRLQHKKECKKRAAELHDEALFKQPPPEEDCPICMIRLPMLRTGSKYMSCCGKEICCGCIFAPVYDHEGNEVDEESCPFCRSPPSFSDQDTLKRVQKRVKAGDAEAIFSLGQFYNQGLYGLPQDYEKALELWHRAGELGSAAAYCSIGLAYGNGRGVDVDKKKAKHYWELAAMGGNAIARHNLGYTELVEGMITGCIELRAGNKDRALKHFMIAAKSGENNSLKRIKQLYSNGNAAKDDYTQALQSYQTYLDEIKSDQRDEAAAAHVNFKYFE